MYRKIVLLSPIPICFGAALVKTASGTNKNEEQSENLAHYKCKPSDLPIYEPLHSLDKMILEDTYALKSNFEENAMCDICYDYQPKEITHEPRNSVITQAIENSIKAVRVEVESGYNLLSSQKDKFTDIIDTGKAHSKFLVDYLNEPDNTYPRIGAIAIGGLSGFIFALRGGFIKKVLYSGIGAAAIASICYPEEAGKYAQKGAIEAKKSATIAYNFAFGVKPGDNQMELPKIPTKVSELTDSISDMAKSAKDALFSSKK